MGLGTKLGQHSTPGAPKVLWQTAWTAAPGLSALALADAAVRGAATPLRYVALGGLVAAVRGGDGPEVTAATGLLLAVVAAHNVLPHLTEPVVRELGRRVDLQLRLRVVAATAAPVGIAVLEDAGTHDAIAAAQGVGGGGPGGSLAGYLNLAAMKLSAVGSLFLLAQYRWWLGVFVLVGSMVVRRRILSVWFRLGEALRGDVPELRRVAYLRDLAIAPPAAKELRIFGFGGWLRARHAQVWAGAMAEVWQRRRQIGAQMPGVVGAVLVVAGVAAGAIAVGVRSGDVDAGRAVVLVGALSAIIELGGFLPQADFPIRFGALALPALDELEARVARDATTRPRGAASVPDWQTIELRAVSFRYHEPDGEKVLDDLDLTIRRGETVAIVGANGAGKTTITKLLARLYEPSAGAILVDGVDLRQLDVERWRADTAVIFQDFARFELTARENVGFGAVELLDDDAALASVAEQAGIAAAVDALPFGWDSPLSRSYTGGADLSGGQWQRVALARALLAVRGGAGLLVLDEPTASLDVRAEAEFYERFVRFAEGVSTILISHRFSTVRRADRICVLDGGRIIEEGSHEALLRAGGRYAHLFRLQAARFADA